MYNQRAFSGNDITTDSVRMQLEAAEVKAASLEVKYKHAERRYEASD